MSADFFDRNIFISLFDPTDDRKRSIAHGLLDAAIETDRGCLSFQVVQESSIVAAALETGCKRLLTEDMQDGQRIEGLRIENPCQR